MKAILDTLHAQLKFDRSPREFSQDDINLPPSEFRLALIGAAKNADCLALAAELQSGSVGPSPNHEDRNQRLLHSPFPVTNQLDFRTDLLCHGSSSCRVQSPGSGLPPARI
jgi:hypothetical protein